MWKNSSKKQISLTKKGNWKGAGFGPYKDSFKSFSVCAKAPNTVNYSASRKNISQRCKNCVNIDVFGGVVNIALCEKTS